MQEKRDRKEKLGQKVHQVGFRAPFRVGRGQARSYENGLYSTPPAARQRPSAKDEQRMTGWKMKSRTLPVGSALLVLCLLAAESVSAQSATPLSLRDTLSFREIDSVHMAPDGHAVAYVTHVADLATNKNPHALKVIDADGRDDRALLNADDLENVSWGSDNRTLYGLAERDGRYVIVKADTVTGKSDDIASSDEKINSFACAPDGRTCVFTTAEQADTATQARRKDGGMVYQWGPDSVLSILNRDYTLGEWENFHIVDVGAKTGKPLYRLKYDGPGRHLSFIFAMKFSPDGRKVALSLWRRGDPAKGGAAFNADIAILDIDKAEFIEVVPDSILSEGSFAWSADSNELLFVQESGLKRYDLRTQRLDPLAWTTLPDEPTFGSELVYDSERRVAYARTRRASYEFDFKKNEFKASARTSPDMISLDSAFATYAFVDQASERRPEVTIHDKATGKDRRVTNLNPWLDRHALGKVEKIEIENSSKVKVDAYLVYPVDYVQGKRYPLVIGTYGFRGRFILTAEWHTTFPAQTLAGQGYAVLLLNTPPSGQSTANDPVKARDLEGWQMLSTFENAVDKMVAQGIADPECVGLYGWSHGAFVVEFLLAHSKKHYKAAALGEGGDYNPSEYAAFGMTTWPKVFQNIYGGPFNEKTAPAYLGFAPVFKAENFEAPLLMEFSGKDGFFGLEMYVPLRVLRKPAELVTYDDEEHNFVKPRARLASMARKVDWFNFWMLDKEDPDPSKAEQYTRWRQMRDERDADQAAASAEQAEH